MNLLFFNSDHEQTYHEQPEIVNSTNDDQINSDVIFDDLNVEIYYGNVEHDKNAHDQHDNELELLAINAYKEAEKQLILEASTSSGTPTSASTSSSPPLIMPSSSKLIRHFHMLENEIKKLYTPLETETTPESIFYINREDTILSQLCYDEVTPILDYLHTIFKAIQREFPEEVKLMMDVFVSKESDLDETLP
ncbi:hypothetical protein Tco_1071516 [Tanacetum coccineum]